MKTAIIILGHGSRSTQPDCTITRVADFVREKGGYEVVAHAFLQHGNPTFPDALEDCIREHSERIIIIPFFMQPGAHVIRDVPTLVDKARREHPGIKIIVSDFAGNHPLMCDIVLDLAGRAIEQ